MTKGKFCSVLLGRFKELGPADRYELFSELMNGDLEDAESGKTDFAEEQLVKILFPEGIQVKDY